MTTFFRCYTIRYTKACLKIAFKPSDCMKLTLLWQIPKILSYGSCMGTLVLEPCFLRLYAPLRFPFKRKRAAIGKILELPGRVNL
ncbi:hypothetical protein D7V86_16765 [bacterium D16-51]|nr:hypothetical protein D7V96_19655 [bacterium D16-59]RKI57901.1 hypothetical protein D7V86_16765 [bacterium D16-51]